jgi:serine/threonine-protein kinase RsbW
MIPMMRDRQLVGSFASSPSPPEELSIELLATSHSVRQALRRLELFLLHSDIAPGDQGTVALVLAEVLNNIAEHACGTEDRIRFTIRFEEGAVSCVVRDRGRAFPPQCFEYATPPDPGKLPEGGFGLHIIRSLTQGLRYCRRFDENRLSFRIVTRAGSP